MLVDWELFVSPLEEAALSRAHSSCQFAIPACYSSSFPCTIDLYITPTTFDGLQGRRQSVLIDLRNYVSSTSEEEARQVPLSSNAKLLRRVFAQNAIENSDAVTCTASSPLSSRSPDSSEFGTLHKCERQARNRTIAKIVDLRSLICDRCCTTSSRSTRSHPSPLSFPSTLRRTHHRRRRAACNETISLQRIDLLSRIIGSDITFI